MKDKLVFTPYQQPLAKEIGQFVLKHDKYPCVVCIGGLSGSGKTEIAELVHNELKVQGKYVKIISQDSYYCNDHEKVRVKTGHESVGINEINWVCITNAIGNLKFSHVYDVVIFEGLYACSDKIDANYKFYIDQSYEDSYFFRKLRKKEKPDDSNRKLVLIKEQEAIERTKQYADKVLTYEEQ